MRTDQNVRKFQFVIPACLLIALVFFGSWHATKGLDMTDEGMYLSSSMRYALGDTPFRDEIINTLRSFDILVTPVFILAPNITLLQVRYVGLFLHLTTYVLFFFSLSRYAPPFYVSLLCSVMFLFNNFFGILSPSYYMLSSDFSLLSLSLYLFALASDNKVARLFLSGLAGVFFGFMVISYSTQIGMILVPLILIAVDTHVKSGRTTYRDISFCLVASSGLLLALFFIVLSRYGLMHDYFNGFAELARSTELGSQGGISAKMLRIAVQLLRVLPVGFVLISGLLFGLSVAVRRRPNVSVLSRKFVIGSLVYFILLFYFAHAVFLRTVRNMLLDHYFYPIAALSFALLLIPAILTVQNRRQWNSTTDGADNILIVAIIWGLLSTFLNWFSSDNSMYAAVQGVSPLFVGGSILLYRRVRCSSDGKGNMEQNGPGQFVLTIMTAVFLAFGARYYYKCVYRNEEVRQLTREFTHPKLKGIYSTPAKVKAVEDLLEYLKGRVNPGDRFLAYNYIPMLYFLTDTRPAYGTVWARDNWRIETRQRLLDEMLKKHWEPTYCVRMLTFPGGESWAYGMTYDEDSPLDVYVHSYYYLEKMIFPFEVWRRGEKSKYGSLTMGRPVFKDSFEHWKGPASIGMDELSRVTSPLSVLDSVREGSFDFSIIKEPSRLGNVLRVFPVHIGKKGSLSIQFGYRFLMHGKGSPIRPGQEVVFLLKARLSSVDKAMYPFNSASIFIRDKQKSLEGNSAIVYTTKWEQYVVSKTIRENADEVALGIAWDPEHVGDWLEIRDVQVYLAMTS